MESNVPQTLVRAVSDFSADDVKVHTGDLFTVISTNSEGKVTAKDKSGKTVTLSGELIAPAMASENKVDDLDLEENGYKVSAKVSASELLQKDKDDESLNRYKQQLLGNANVVVFPDDNRRIIVKSFNLVFADHEPISFDPNDKNIKNIPYILKEGTNFNLVIKFYCQRDIVSNLRYKSKIYKHSIKVDTVNEVLGSYGPKADLIEVKLPDDCVASGFLARGSYTTENKLDDEDGFIHLQFETSFEIKSDWK